VLDEHVEVAHVPERVREPRELGAQRLRPGGIDEVLRAAEQRTQPPRRDSLLVHLLGVAAEADAGVVRQHRVRVHAQPTPELLQRRVLERRLDVRLPAERAQHLRLAVAAPRARAAERLAEPAQQLLRPVDQLHLDLREGVRDALPVEDGDAVEHDLGEPLFAVADEEATPARPQRRDGLERRAPQHARQQRPQLRRRRRPAGHLDLEPRDALGQLELPEAEPVFHAPPQRDARAREPPVGRVEVRGDERALVELVAELREREVGLHVELQLALGVGGHRHASRDCTRAARVPPHVHHRFTHRSCTFPPVASRDATAQPMSRSVRRAVYVAALAALAVAAILAATGVGDLPGRLSDWQAFVLGVVQGLTEFLPISSSGHLILVPWIADWHYLEQHPDFNKTFDVALHLGTLVAVVVYFWRDIGRLLAAWFRTLPKRRIEGQDERIAWYVAIATVPAVIFGAALESTIDEHLGQPYQIAIFLAVFGVLLWIADRRPQRTGMEGLGYRSALGIGLAQVLALMPGVSRSGVTITAGRFLELDRDAAARFSFLLLVPVTFGAVIYKGAKHVVFESLPPGSTGPFVVGTVAAAGAGLIAIDALLGYVRRHDYTPFVVFRLAMALAVLLVIASGARSAHFG
jgi:undecaprenyl-diphosphatase